MFGSECEISCCRGEECAGDVDCDCWVLEMSPPRLEVRGETRPVWKMCVRACVVR